MEPQAKIREHFQRLDKNGDGSLDVGELRELLMEMGITREQSSMSSRRSGRGNFSQKTKPTYVLCLLC